MKNYRTTLAILVSLALGLAGGYLIFGGESNQIAGPGTGGQAADAQAGEASNEQIWTCSMHPQIRQNEPGECPICGMDLIPLSSMSSDDPLMLEMTQEAVKLANIQTTVVGSTGSAEKNLILSGKISADERLSASQVAHVPGRIERLFVTFTGEQVKKGQKLVTLYSPELITAQKELLEAIKFEDVNPGLVQAARKKLKFWKVSQDQIREIEESGEIHEIFTVFTDATGIVTNRRVAVGDYVRQGQVLFDIVSLDRVWVLFDAYEEDLAAIKVGDRISFTTPAIPDRSFRTRISFIDPVINPRTRVASLRGELQNPGNILKPEMFVRGELNARISAKEQLLVPKSAILWTGQRSVAYVKIPDTNIPTYQFREVRLGESVGDAYLVEEGIEPGEEVVTYGNFAIDAAAQLNNQMSMMNRNVMLKGMDAAERLPDYTESTPVSFKEQLAEVTGNYLALKDALVATDPDNAREEAGAFLSSLPKVDMTLVEGDAHMYWMDQSIALQAHGKKISELDDVEKQREQFDFLSRVLIHTIRVFGVPDDTLYVQHCPMAFDDDGADWISRELEIRNPYFGDRMLKCGLVQDTITKE